ncbi:hypothetical protein PG993_012750 [Apiospora rasikravindrae]|uniref:Hypersensitive response-inducing protein n=1 Tax=Apiospora rasikravindrae TaxID=990691 RepID=A0ABR1RW34_9PEZI
MKFFATALAAAAAVSGAAVKRDQVTDFRVSSFSAECTPHSVMCHYSFDVYTPGTMETAPGAHCSADVLGNPDGTLPEVRDGKCENSGRTWDMLRFGSGIIFSISTGVSPHSNTTGAYLLVNSNLKMQDEVTSIVQKYIGTPDFDLKRL